jgi:phosphoribosylanthranilate isomerase
MADSVKRFGLDGIQLHGEESREVVCGLRKVAPEVEILKAFPIHGVSSFMRLQEYEDVVDFFLLDGQEPGSGMSFDWSILDSYLSHRDFFLAGGVSAGDVNRIRSIATRVKSLRGIDVNSRVEISPGVKSIELIREVLEGVRV